MSKGEDSAESDGEAEDRPKKKPAKAEVKPAKCAKKQKAPSVFLGHQTPAGQTSVGSLLMALKLTAGPGLKSTWPTSRGRN